MWQNILLIYPNQIEINVIENDVLSLVPHSHDISVWSNGHQYASSCTPMVFYYIYIYTHNNVQVVELSIHIQMQLYNSAANECRLMEWYCDPCHIYRLTRNFKKIDGHDRPYQTCERETKLEAHTWGLGLILGPFPTIFGIVWGLSIGRPRLGLRHDLQ